jgi:urease accessory protein
MSSALLTDRGEWPARLRLDFARQGARTVLAHQDHEGPLVVQKALYPEGPERCHAIIVHPPGGIAGGDRLSIDVVAQQQAHALLTTPGASKWYRSLGPTASSTAHLKIESNATLEWLPREAIVFDGSRVHARLEIDVAAQGRCIGWEIWCLGRTASGERLRQGRVKLETRLRIAGRLCWEERGVFEGGSEILESAAGFAGCPVHGTLWATGLESPRALLNECRAVRPIGTRAQAALTQLPGVLLARYLGPSTEEAFEWLATIWSIVRPALMGCEAVRPRIWAV